MSKKKKPLWERGKGRKELLQLLTANFNESDLVVKKEVPRNEGLLTTDNFLRRHQKKLSRKIRSLKSEPTT